MMTRQIITIGGMRAIAQNMCAIGLFLAGCTSNFNNPIDYADPMVGTGFHGHTFPGATTPFGAVQLSPDTRAENWDACSGYHYSDSTLDGFSHTHLSGTGCCDLGDVLFRPTTAEIILDADTLYRAASFSHSDETARPGFYSVRLSDEGIFAELTTTTHTGLHRYTFPEGKPAQIIIDLDHTLSGEDVYEASMHPTADNEISGTRITDGWVDDHHVHFTSRFSQPFAKCEIIRDGRAAVLTFENTGKPIVAAVALSGVSEDNSRLNLDTEVAELNFDAIADKAKGEWEDALSVISVEGGTPDQMKNFYSALYHTMVTPNQMSDVNGQFRRNNDEIGTTSDNKKYYNTFSLWDTFRAWHPLMTIIKPEFVCDMINSMLDMYDATGELPVWSLASGETGCMIGYHSVSAIADAYMKGIDCFDAEKALTAMVNSTGTPRKGADIYAERGYIPSDLKSESVSCTIEYSYDDWCIARMAEKLGNDSIARKYYQRAKNYRNVFDSDSRFFRGRESDGSWKTPFNPNAVNHDLTEATAWQYRFGAIHDIEGMVELFGGKDAFAEVVDSIFIAPGVVGEQSDITGLIGQYSHGNEPSHHIAYLYNYIDMPWKTQALTRRLLNEMYQPTPEGLCGNEDCGQMSAWYVMTALGFYPVTPGSNEFALTSPIFEKATIRLPNGKFLNITSNNPAKNKYIEKITLNGKEIKSNFLSYQDIMRGGELAFTLTDSATTPPQQSNSELNVMTFNIRYDNPDDLNNNWKYRKDRVANAIKFYDADIVGTQEVLKNQFDDLKERLPGYDIIGVGREDGKEEGEYNALLLKKNRFNVVKSGTFWLSETPDIEGSKGWDGACKRIATWARLLDTASGKAVLVLNTHLDHVGHIARQEGVNLIFNKVNELSKGAPIIVTGDFNSTPDSDVVRHITNPSDENHLTNSKEAAKVVYGPNWSFHDFGSIPYDERPQLDYVFIRGDIDVNRYGVLAETENGQFLSDHAPVLVTLTLNSKL